jgi:hypothetical protein
MAPFVGQERSIRKQEGGTAVQNKYELDAVVELSASEMDAVVGGVCAAVVEHASWNVIPMSDGCN